MTLYPALRRFFRSNQELADAACMGRTRLWKIQRGEAEFTEQEKAAIARAIKLKELKVNVEAADLDKYKRKDLI
jgi:hypothetical protein